MGNLLIAQSGGPTAAINATLAGAVTCAYTSGKVDKVLGAINGIEGVLQETFIDLGEKLKGTGDLDLLCQTPAAALGSCRFKLKDIHTDQKQFENIVSIFRKHNISYFIYIGGNDSMDTVDKLSQYCALNNIDGIKVVGAPKTIDNDLVETDHCPGFGSAAKYIGVTFGELERDCQVYDTKAVTIVEVMGRNAGWLTAASALSRVAGQKGPSLIYLCEAVFDNDKFISDVKAKLEESSSVLVAVSEGIKNKDGLYVSEEVQSGAQDVFGHNYIAGAARVLEDLVREQIGCKVRSVELNLMQRCGGHIVSATDLQESRMLGMKACQCALEGESGVMATVIRTNSHPYQVTFDRVKVSKVSNREKKVPMEWLTKEGNDVTSDMMDYLLPLIQGENQVIFEHGIPKYLSLYE